MDANAAGSDDCPASHRRTVDVGGGHAGVVTTDPPAEEDLRPLDPRVRTLWWIEGGIRTAVLAILTGVAVVIAPDAAAAVLGGLTALSLAAALVLPALRYRRWRWAIRADDIWVRQGLLWVTTSVVPFSRLQFVDTRHGPLERALGLATLVLHTAALGSTTTIPGLPADQAEQLRERLADVDPDVLSV